MKRLKFNNTVFALLVALAFCNGGAVSAQDDIDADIDQLKVAFIFNFSKYFSWPDDEKWSQADTFNICIESSSVLNGQFDSLIGQSTQDKAIKLIDLSQTNVDISDTCQIWYVGTANFRSNLKKLEAVNGNSVLTVGDHPGFATDGGIVELSVVDNRLRFKIDADLAAEEKLRVSSRLMALAITEDK